MADLTEAQQDSRRTDPRYDLRRVVVYFTALIAFYVAVVVATGPPSSDISALLTGLAFAPTFGALAAVLFAHASIQFGRPTKHIFWAFLPPAAILVVTWVVAGFTSVDVQAGNLVTLLALSVVMAVGGSLTAIGEEIGWRGFLWPLMRRRTGFWISSGLMLVIWWLYHVPAILWWGYGSTAGLAAFTIAIAGFVLFVGVLTDRSRAIWPSLLAHGAWNGMVAKAYFASLASGAVPTCDGSCPDFSGPKYVFVGPQNLLGEFGWIAALTMLVIGLVAAWWHLRHPVKEQTAD